MQCSVMILGFLSCFCRGYSKKSPRKSISLSLYLSTVICVVYYLVVDMYSFRGGFILPYNPLSWFGTSTLFVLANGTSDSFSFLFTCDSTAHGSTSLDAMNEL